MSYLINVLIIAINGFIHCDGILYLLAAFAFYCVIQLIRKAVYGIFE